jgi:hypothetical protein
MSYFIAISTLNGHKPISRMLYPTKREAVAEAERRNATQYGSFFVMDADHEPGQSIIRNSSGF